MSSSSAPRKRTAAGVSPVMSPRPQANNYSNQDQIQQWNGAAAMGNNNYNHASNMFMPQQPQQQQNNQQQQLHQMHQPQMSQMPQMAQMPQMPQQTAVNGHQAQQGYDFTSQDLQAQQFTSPTQSSNPGSSNMLARRPNAASRALVPARENFDFAFEGGPQWSSNENALVPSQNVGDLSPQEYLEALARAQRIAKESQSERGNKKGMAPFVQKLSTFLNNNSDPHIISWSAKGNSFIVYDEDEFARNLIPTLFKHSNYASFVRQLNMYGFHKEVGLGDNSMRASEKKNKAPNEYKHKYFIRGHDILQWLIGKPNKGKNADKRKGGGSKPEDANDIDSDDDLAEPQAHAIPGTIAKTEVTRMREQLAALQANHSKILSMIGGLQNSHENIIKKVSKNETTVSSILNFLVNVFRQSVQGKRSEHLDELLSSVMNMQGQGGNISTGSVQDLGDMSGAGDFEEQQNDVQRGSLSPVPRHRQRLLPGIPVQDNSETSNDPGTMYADSAARTSGYPTSSFDQTPTQQTSRVTELDTSPEDTTSPNLGSELTTTPQEAFMRMMSASNEAAASSSAPTSMEQRRIQASRSRPQTQQNWQQNNEEATSLPDMSPAGIMEPDTHQGTQPSLSAPAPTPLVDNNAHQSPLIHDAAIPMANMSPQDSLMDEATQAGLTLQQIEKTTQDVDQGIQRLAKYTAMMPPSNSVPGFDGSMENDLFGGALTNLNNDGAFDPDDWLHNDDGGAFGSNFDLNNFDFSVNDVDMSNLGVGGMDFMAEYPTNTDSTGDNESAAPVAASLGVSNNAMTGIKTSDTPSPADTEEIERDDLEMPAAKRHRAA